MAKRPRVRPKAVGVTMHCDVLRSWLNGRHDLIQALGKAVHWSRGAPPAADFVGLLDLANAYVRCNPQLCFSLPEVMDAIQYLHGSPDGPVLDLDQPHCLPVVAKNAASAVCKIVGRFRELKCADKGNAILRKAIAFCSCHHMLYLIRCGGSI